MTTPPAPVSPLSLDDLLHPVTLAGLARGVVVVKVGGSIQDDPAQMRLVMRDVAMLNAAGAYVTVVHGGGKAISAAMKDAGLTPRFVKGQRYTDAPTLRIAERVLARGVNAELVAMLRDAGCRALGLHSLGCCVLGAVRAADESGEDLGYVGRVPGDGDDASLIADAVQADVLHGLLVQGIAPVIAPVAMDLRPDGADAPGRLNVNADLAAGAVAARLGAARFILVSDTPGVRTGADASTYVATLTRGRIDQLRAQGVIDGGMLPKVQACLRALDAAARSVWIVDGRVPLATLAAATDHARTPGTRVTN